ncbi:MAG TPA: sporulation integral membrane protein YlbJ [Verrucomicrobiae bacterium]|nr:sporulation integral membrane protein YlbJ [Verrucomicrobiae bacterium]
MLQKHQAKALGKTGGIIILAVVMVVYPQEVLSAATQGVTAWARFVLPALLPFFILSELLMGSGFVHLLGVLLEPIMRPLFRLPGSAAFVVAMGFTSGPPIGAVLTAKLKRENLVTATEAERLLAFTNNASPGFVLGAVAAGMFNNPGLGLVFAFASYLANLLLGVGMRFYRSSEQCTPVNQMREASFLRRAFRAMVTAQRKDGRPLGQLIGDSIRNSINTILIVGGFILFFSVLIRLLSILGVLQVLTRFLSSALQPLHLSSSLYPAITNGLFEMTLGTRAASQAAAPFTQQVLLVSAILAWSGISVHAQVASFVAGTGIRLGPFLFGRMIQTCLSVVITALALPFMGSAPVFKQVGSVFTNWQMQLFAVTMALLATLCLLLALSLSLNIITRLRSILTKVIRT